jgi:hypothetical protein
MRSKKKKNNMNEFMKWLGLSLFAISVIGILGISMIGLTIIDNIPDPTDGPDPEPLPEDNGFMLIFVIGIIIAIALLTPFLYDKLKQKPRRNSGRKS